MTTVACDGEEMAADSRETAGEVITGNAAKKLWKLTDGRIVGCAGQPRFIFKFISWLEDHPDNDSPPNLKEVSALILHPDGTLEMYDGGGVIVPQETPAAIGTGFISALTAMDMGANARQAVKMAMKRDPLSGGRVQSMRLSDNL